MEKISGSVGIKGKNRLSDVKLIQLLINKNSKSDSKASALKADGVCGPRTVAAIKNFQLHQLGMVRPDGRVDPSGKTFSKLISLAPAKARPAQHVTAFINSIAEEAKKAAKAWNVPASVLIAQAAHESGWGRHVKGNAYFGIKGKSPSGKSTNFATKEVVDGKVIGINDNFRAYENFAESADDYGRFLNENPRYKSCFENSKDPYQFVKQLANAGYATDPDYEKKIANLIRKYELTQYDDK